MLSWRASRAQPESTAKSFWLRSCSGLCYHCTPTLRLLGVTTGREWEAVATACLVSITSTNKNMCRAAQEVFGEESLKGHTFLVLRQLGKFANTQEQT